MQFVDVFEQALIYEFVFLRTWSQFFILESHPDFTDILIPESFCFGQLSENAFKIFYSYISIHTLVLTMN